MPNTVFTSCVKDATYTEGPYRLDNDMWGEADAQGQAHSQCITVFESNSTNVIAEFIWQWPVGGSHVKGYPDIIYGQTAWRDFSTTPHLPVQVNTLGQITADYDTAVTLSDGSRNAVIFDIWVNGSNPPDPNKITNEVMIYINNMDADQAPYDGMATIDGQDYNYVTRNVGWLATVFVKTNQEEKGELRLDHFLNFLVDKDIISPTNYLIDVEFGSEPRYGNGTLEINNFSISMVDGGVMSTTINLTGISSGNVPATPISITAAAADPTLFSSIVVNYTDPSATGNVVLTPTVNANGTTPITVTVDNHQPKNNILTRIFNCNVKKINPPTLDAISDVTLYS